MRTISHGVASAEGNGIGVTNLLVQQNGVESMVPSPVVGSVSPRRSLLDMKFRLMLGDLAALLIGGALAFAMQRLVRPVPRFVWTDHLTLFFIGVPFFALGAGTNHLYRARDNERPSQESLNIVKAVGTGMAGLVAVALGLQYKDLSRLWIVAVAVTVTGTLMIDRAIARRIFARMRREGTLRRRIVIVGTDAHAIGLLHRFQRRADLGYEVVGFVGTDDIGERGGVGVLGGFDDLLPVLSATEAVGVVVSLGSVTSEVVNQMVRRLTDASYHIAISTSLHDIDVSRIRSQQMDGVTFTYVESVIRTGWRALAKRGFDIVIASTILLVTMPIIAIAALCVKFDSPGPVVFRQKRVGLDGRQFQVLKLRSMTIDAEQRKEELRDQNEMDGALFKITNDPRITRFGRIIRKLSIDELPQLINVLGGSMSMVGPRPALPDEVAEWSPEVRDRLRVLPGITGLWQISGRSGTTFEEYKRLDLYYVDNWSLRHDLRICFKTVGVVLGGHGAA